jgi:ATP-dependent DNA ligase
VFRYANKLGLDGIVAKRRDRPYRSGRCADWIKVKNQGRAGCDEVDRGIGYTFVSAKVFTV